MKTIGYLAGAGLVLSACSGESSAEFTQPSNPTVQALQGTWGDPCDAEGDEQARRNVLEIHGNRMLFNMNMYADQSCSELMLGMRLGGNYTVGDAVHGVEGAYEMDAVLDQFDARVTSSEFAVMASEEEMLGVSDWQPNVPQNLFGIMGLDDGEQPIQSGTRLYLMIKVDDSGVYFGDGDGPGLSEDDRGEGLNENPMARMGN